MSAEGMNGTYGHDSAWSSLPMGMRHLKITGNKVMNDDTPESNNEAIAEILAQAEALLKELRENPPTEEEIREFRFNRNPFEEIARGLTQATELEKVIDGDMTPDCLPDDLAALADAKAAMMRQRKLLLEDWEWELSQAYPPSN